MIKHMTALRDLLLAAILASTAPAFAQSPQDHEAHHPEAQPTAPTGSMMGPGMMGQGSTSGGMMIGQGQMRAGMMMGQGQPGSTVMPMTNMIMRGRSGPEHIEGRLAYIRVELKITDAQTPQWNAFADAARTNAKAVSELRSTMMSRQGASATLPDRLALEDKVVTAHLEALKKIEDAANKLYSVLNEEQKKLADSIIIGPMGMPMGMM
jgi:hypothetical protein